jgi:hypothetical protein
MYLCAMGIEFASIYGFESAVKQQKSNQIKSIKVNGSFKTGALSKEVQSAPFL